MKEAIQNSVHQSLAAVMQLSQPNVLEFIERVAHAIASCLTAGGKIIVAGNGGSSCDAAHFAQELTGFFRGSRPALPAIALTEHGHITCTANDLGYEWVFSRGVEAFGQPGDIFVGLTTSGNSPSIIRAMEVATARGLTTVAFLGKGGGKLKGSADFELIIEELKTSDRIQEAHMTAIHIIIEMVERVLFSAGAPAAHQEKSVPSYN